MKRREAKELGLLYYETGKPCLNGHYSKRVTSCGNCYACMKEHIARNPKTKEWKRLWEACNQQKVKEYRKTYIKNNRSFKNSLNALRRIDKLKRTPSWLSEDDLFLIQEAYDLAQKRTKLFGFVWHVDHIIPLKGRSVSGLHTPLNLQVIPAKVNLIKKNSYVVGELI